MRERGEQILDHWSLKFKLGGLVFDIPTMLMITLTAILVFVLLVVLSRQLTTGVPDGRQNLLEWVVDFINNLARSVMDAKTAARFITLAVTVFLYIILGNWLGLGLNVTTLHHNDPAENKVVSEQVVEMLTISGTPEAQAKKIEKVEHALEPGGHGIHIAWWKSPTAAASVTFSLALTILLYSQYVDIRRHGLGTYLKHFLNPLHILEELVIKPLTLPLRLFGNIFAGEVLIAFLMSTGVFIGSIPLLAWLGYSVFVGAVQAYIFTTLTIIYISQKTNDGH
ncbi:F0F1 ATP synthase subunit A [Brevibacillus laterosporus]|uniref:F0F1 ATP synthase subunit A n=1 Tax=Brevibacillus laterosporus TaxID=1465 RepID=UPI0003697476|nr:F0F1 ATP synthase subunit A [Brevibacillus laterosporus]ATO49179.1 ATP synthase F0 subunit A [Brevibacillus laterosporus DSM 25]MBG9803574.1 ATP synthase subunit A [Brevibacillus laterosporus]MED2003520.1 F0F1 ATP synthase subunit A [Brevibacillus laterosporus]MED4763136.1 F0F1 ATP synthase subunit A [Brevibacillus laterosporus]TPH19804.1 ATP synthase F0 subunit A [Brevibacillus laterosporus]